MKGLATELPVDLKVSGPLRLEGFDSRVVKVSLGAKHSGKEPILIIRAYFYYLFLFSSFLLVALSEKGTVYTWGTGRGVGLDPASPMPYLYIFPSYFIVFNCYHFI